MMHPKHISTYILAAATSMLSLFAVLPCQAQSKKKIIEQQPDTIPFFRGMAVGVDLIGPVQLMVSDYGQYEASLRINLKDKYYPVFELGYGKADASDEATQITYKTSAPYFRLGVDWNLLKNKHDDYRLFGGFRYACTYYEYDLSAPSVTDPVWGGETPYGGNGISCNYHWLEGVIGIDAKIWGPVRMGWSFRYKRRLFKNNGELGNTWYVPGYGKQGGSRLGGTFNVTLEI